MDELQAAGIKPVTRTFNTLMIACNTSSQWQEALRIWGQMRAQGYVPNTTTYNALISAYSRGGLIDKVGARVRRV
jgi:pentatricopeptide repeat domain-containing protein 1